jgi:hypothetical protein
LKIILLPILLVMLLVCTLHSHYSAILDQFFSQYKVLETATINSVVNDVQYHNGFQLVGLDKKASGARAPKAAVATAANVDQQGTVWTTPFEWLSSYGLKGYFVRGSFTTRVSTGVLTLVIEESLTPYFLSSRCLTLYYNNIIAIVDLTK